MRKIGSRFFMFCGVLVLLSTFPIVISVAVSAEKAFPNHEIEIAVPYAPGGMVDLATRVVSEDLSKAFGVPVVVVNKSAGNGVEAIQYVSNAKPDGHTMLMATNVLFGLLPAMQSNLPYKISDFIPITRYVNSPNLILVRKESSWKNLEELVAYSKKNPGKLTCGTAGVGSATHFSLELLNIEAGLDIRHVPFRGGAPANTALLGGHVDFGCIALPTVIGLLQSGELRGLASTAGKISAFPEIPTIAEKGYPGATLGLWTGLFVYKTVDRSVVATISKTFKKIVKSPQVIPKFVQIGFEFDYVSGDPFASGIEKDYKKMVEVVKKANLVIK